MIRQRSLLTLILLSIVTCGIYQIFFFYGWTNDVNLVCAGDGEDSPNYIVVLLLSVVTCGIYGIYWTYKQANRLAKNAPRYGLTIVETGGTVIMWYLIGSLICGLGTLFGTNILIKNLNTLGNVYNQNGYKPNATGNTYVQQTIVVQESVLGGAPVQETSNFCGQCGNKIEVGDQFCAKCGSKKEMGTAANNTQTNSSQIKDAVTNFAKNISSMDIGNIMLGIVGVMFVTALIGRRGYFFSVYSFFYNWLQMACVIGFAVLVKCGKNIKKEYKLLPYVAFCFFEFLNYVGVTNILIYGEPLGTDWRWSTHVGKMGIVFMMIILLAGMAILILNAVYTENLKASLNLQGINITKEKIQLAVLCITLALTIGTVIGALYSIFAYFSFYTIIWDIIWEVSKVARILPLVLFVYLDNQDYINKKLGKM